MASFVFVVTHSTEAPERAAEGLRQALATVEEGHDVALWLTGEGVRLGVKRVAETLREPGGTTAADALEKLAAAGAVLHCVRPSFEAREYTPDALRNGARLSERGALARLVAEGYVPIPT
jgi:predicted peroxiredoxin